MFKKLDRLASVVVHRCGQGFGGILVVYRFKRKRKKL